MQTGERGMLDEGPSWKTSGASNAQNQNPSPQRDEAATKSKSISRE
jgi:hypothetical protein